MEKNISEYNPFPILLNRRFNDQKLGSFWIQRYIKFVKAIQIKRLTNSINEKWNVHGHLHSGKIDDKRYFNACVDAHPQFTLWSLDQVLSSLKDVPYVPKRRE